MQLTATNASDLIGTGLDMDRGRALATRVAVAGNGTYLAEPLDVASFHAVAVNRTKLFSEKWSQMSTEAQSDKIEQTKKQTYRWYLPRQHAVPTDQKMLCHVL